MQSKVVKKCLLFGTVILLAGMSMQGSTQGIQNRSTRTILYVGGDGPGNYTSIQDAINDAMEGDTVFVYDDMAPYYEQVVITKRIDLIGENKETTIIDGIGYSGITLSLLAVTEVTISGFTIQSGLLGLYLSSASNNHIFENNIIDNSAGIYLEDASTDNTIFQNTMQFNYEAGIIITTSSNHNDITDNSILSNFEFGLYQDSAIGSTIANNTITENTIDGLRIQSSSSNTIIDNTVTNNGDFGIVLVGCNNDNVVRNTLIYNSYGIAIGESIDCELYHNTFIENDIGNAYDEQNNAWDDGYPSGGNYWDDYSGDDTDGDGIGDTPYSIPDGISQDRYPLMIPYGTLRVNANGPYTGEINDVVEFSGFVCGGVPPYTWHWDFGDGNISDEQNPTHIYYEADLYTVNLTVEDAKGNISWDVTTATIVEPTPCEPEIIIEGGTELLIRISNPCDSSFLNLKWNVTIEGGLIVIPRESSDTIEILESGESEEISISVFGIGLGLFTPTPEITVTLSWNDNSTETSTTAKIFLNRVLL